MLYQLDYISGTCSCSNSNCNSTARRRRMTSPRGVRQHISRQRLVAPGGAGGCRCSDYNVGCQISIPAEPGKACRCIFNLGKWDPCEEAVAVACSDPASKYCKNPDPRFVQRIMLGSDNCRGY